MQNNKKFQSAELINLKKSEANENTSPVKKFKTNEQQNLQQKDNDESIKSALYRISPMKTNTLMTESSAGPYLNHSSASFTVDSLFNQSNNSNSSFNSPLSTIMPPYSSQPNKNTACSDVSKTLSSNKNKINNFESFLNNKFNNF
jgi:hypothetical protein